MEKGGRVGLRAALFTLLAAPLLSVLLLLLVLLPSRTWIGGWLVPRSSEELDLSALPIRSTWGLSRLKDPRYIDLRGCLLDAEEMLRLTARFPDCEFLWEVPIGGERYDCRSLSLELLHFDEADIPALSLFPDLQQVDGRQCQDPFALYALSLARPELRVLRCVPLGSRRVDGESRELTLDAADASYEELWQNLICLPQLRSLTITGPSLSPQQADAICERYGELRLDYPVRTVGGLWFSSQTEELSLGGCQGFTLEELRPLLPCFPALRRIDLSGCGFDNDALRDFALTLDGIELRWSIPLYGAELYTTQEELDLSGRAVDDGGAALEAALEYFPHVKKVIMSDCGLSNEEMDALDQRHEDVRFVWTVYFGAFYLRTDATTFIATTFPHGYSFLTNEELEPLRYCRDLIALDLGHMEYSDASFLRSLPKLRYLILADTRITDISMLSELKELYYLELFLTDIRDISPLLECKNLRHLNLSYCTLKNPQLLGEMTWLERLWIPGVNLSWEALQKINKNLTNTQVERFCESSTGGTWRTDKAYYEMRDVFGVYYMPG